MKKASILLTLLFLLLCINACSQKSQPVAYAVFKDSTLTFYYNDKKPEGAYDVENLIKIKIYNGDDFFIKEWDSLSNQIKTVVFDKSFKKYRPKSCYHWFYSCINLTSIKGIKENLNTSEVTDMRGMFNACKNLTSIDVSGFNTANVTDMRYMFALCEKLTSLDVSRFNTSNVTDMSKMFSKCIKLTSIDVSGFNTKNVTDMMCIFSDCPKLTSIDVSGFNTANVTNMLGMFWRCENLTSLDVSRLNTENVTDMSFLFAGCRNLTSLDVSRFNTENVTDIGEMFYGCSNLQTIYVSDGWNMRIVTDSEDMFKDCPNLLGGKGTKYDDDHTDIEYAHIDGGESNPGYLTKKTK